MFEKADGSLYKYMPYQVYVATSMLANEDFIVAVQMVAGQGKTFIILILVKKHL